MTYRRLCIHALVDPGEAVRLALEALRRLGVRFPADPNWLRLRWDQWRTDRILRRRADRELLVPAAKLPEEWIAAFLILSGSAGSMIRINTRLTLLFVAWVVRKYARFGYYRAPSFALGGYAHLRLIVAPDHQPSQRYGELALWFRAVAPEPLIWPRAAVQIHGVLQPWFLPRRAVLAALRSTYEEAIEVGDGEYAVYALHLAAYHRALGGVLLSETIQAFDETLEIADRWSYASARSVALRRLYGLLVEPAPGSLHASMQTVLEPLSPFDHAAVAPHLMLALCVGGEIDEAIAEAERSETCIIDSTGSAPGIIDFFLFRGFAAGVRAGATEPAPRKRRRADRQLLHDSLIKVRRMARRGPDFTHYPLLLEAERARLAGSSRRALELYDLSARGAAQKQYDHHVGLAHERRSHLLRGLRQYSAADFALRKAVTAYNKWGCARKVAALTAQRSEDALAP